MNKDKKESFKLLRLKHLELLEEMDKAKDDPVKIVPRVKAQIEKWRRAGEYIPEGEERDYLRSILSFWGGFVFEHSEPKEYPETGLHPLDVEIARKAKRIRTLKRVAWPVTTAVAVALMLLVLAGLVFRPVVVVGPTPTPTTTPTLPPSPAPVLTPTCLTDSSKYGFESGVMGWMHQTLEDSQAVTAVAQSERNVAKFGCYSLKLTVDLGDRRVNKSKGEAYVDMRFFPPAKVTTPLNLEEDVQISAWVYVPGAAGSPDRPNGVQLFVKDQNWRSEYGSWFNLTSASWISVTLTPLRTTPLHGGYMESGFDPTKIIMVGIKVGAGAGSETPYLGPIYVDAIDW